jgi:Na+-transporting NADH:ubiquinone oxidoreductase subunit NqrB
MHFFRLYGRVLGLLAADKWVAIGLAAANIALAGLQFLEPVLFGRVVDLLSSASGMSRDAVWTEAFALLALWAAVGLSGIGANVACRSWPTAWRTATGCSGCSATSSTCWPCRCPSTATSSRAA